MPEIVQCKDCRHRYTIDCPAYHEEFDTYINDDYYYDELIEYDNTEDDGFCWKGER